MQLSEINRLQIVAVLGPILRRIDEAGRYVKEGLLAGQIEQVTFWNDRLKAAQSDLDTKSREILAKQHRDAKKAEEDQLMDDLRNQSCV